jgi:polyprenyldihydroxybenzoate methyltransferase / 3-demethylubiquinol 3-O-methyltransferase
MPSNPISSSGGRSLCHVSPMRLTSTYVPLRSAKCRPAEVIVSPTVGQHRWQRKSSNRSIHQHNRHFSTSTSTYYASTSSVSPSEVAHFSRLASSWWDPHGPSRLLHLMNPLRHDFIRTCISSSSTSHCPTQSYSYLDVGCGGGIFATSAARLRATSTVTAIDPTPECIAVAQQKQRSDPALQSPKLSYLNCAIENLPASVGAVDIVTLFEVVEHISVPSTFLTECIKHLKPGGWVIGSTIARSPMSFLTTKVIAEAPVIGIVPRGTHDWNKYINPQELRQWFEAKAEGQWANFQTQGVVYVPMLGWKTVAGSEGWGNYFFAAQKIS